MLLHIFSWFSMILTISYSFVCFLMISVILMILGDPGDFLVILGLLEIQIIPFVYIKSMGFGGPQGGPGVRFPLDSMILMICYNFA